MPRSAPTVDNRTRERLTGAAILVTVIVLVVPELLSRPRHAVPHAEVVVDEAPVRSYTLSLGDTQQSAAPLATEAPARVVPQAPVRAVSQAPAPVTTRAPAPVREAPRSPAPRGKPERIEGSAHGWAVQVGSFGNRGNADRLVRSLKLKGYGAFVTASSSRGRTWYRVRVGPARDRAAADALAVRLRAAGMRGAVAQPR